MHPSFSRSIRVIPRKVLPQNLVPKTAPSARPPQAPTVIQQLVARQQQQGKKWPTNLRIETFEDKRHVWVGIKDTVRNGLKRVIKEK